MSPFTPIVAGVALETYEEDTAISSGFFVDIPLLFVLYTTHPIPKQLLITSLITTEAVFPWRDEDQE